MGFKAWLIKMVINMTPNFIVKTAANLILKDIAELSDFVFDLDNRSAYVNILLAGEDEPIEISVDGFGIEGKQEATYQFIIEQAHSNKLWMNNLLSRVVGKAWDIPDQPQYQEQMELVAEILKMEHSE